MTTTTVSPRDAARIERWALAYLHRLAQAQGRAVLLGGSIARGQQWAHSDLEAGVLVAERDPDLPYFNVDSGRGVELIQLVAGELSGQLEEVDAGNVDAVAQWPIQLYRARVVHDPTALLARFVDRFDRHLFTPRVMRLKQLHHTRAAAATLERANQALAAGRPRSAWCEARYAMNEAVLALHWSLGELPRSQNRTDSRLRELTRRHDRPDFYGLYRDVFDLDSTEDVIARDWPHVKQQVLQLADLTGAAAFFDQAVDGTFSWGENGGIIAVHRLYIPLYGRPEAGLFASLDDPVWQDANPSLLRFLGLADPDRVTDLLARLARTIDALRPEEGSARSISAT